MQHSIQPVTLFDLATAQAERDKGKAIAANARRIVLERAKQIASTLADLHGSIHIDMVMQKLVEEGYTPETLGNAAGSVFRPSKNSEWVWTGEVIQSTRVSRHAGWVRVWRKKQNCQTVKGE
jgi:hypothetical protein